MCGGGGGGLHGLAVAAGHVGVGGVERRTEGGGVEGFAGGRGALASGAFPACRVNLPALVVEAAQEAIMSIRDTAWLVVPLLRAGSICL